MCFGSSDKDYSSQPPRIHRVDGTGRFQFQRHFPNSHRNPGGQQQQQQQHQPPHMPRAPFPPFPFPSGHRGPRHGHAHGPHNPQGQQQHHHGTPGRHHSASRNLPDGPVPPRNPGDPAGWRYRGRMYFQRDPSDMTVDPRMNGPGWFWLHPGKRGGGMGSRRPGGFPGGHGGGGGRGGGRGRGRDNIHGSHPGRGGPQSEFGRGY